MNLLYESKMIKLIFKNLNYNFLKYFVQKICKNINFFNQILFYSEKKTKRIR